MGDAIPITSGDCCCAISVACATPPLKPVRQSISATRCQIQTHSWMHCQSDTPDELARIAAIAKVHQLTVVTRTEADFSRPF
jgi:predicted nucleic acid-binding protein